MFSLSWPIALGIPQQNSMKLVGIIGNMNIFRIDKREMEISPNQSRNLNLAFGICHDVWDLSAWPKFSIRFLGKYFCLDEVIRHWSASLIYKLSITFDRSFPIGFNSPI